jgi:hypothetical protein
MLFITFNNKIKKYNKVLKIRKYIIIFIVTIFIFTIYTNIRNNQYDANINKMKEESNFTGIIVSNETKKEYYTQYTLKITQIGSNTENITIYIRIKGEVTLQYGDEISFVGEYEEPDSARNDKGYNYKNYLKSIRNCRNNYNKRG